MFQTILFAYDGSENAKRALVCAQNVALKFGATVRVVTAFNPISRIIGNPAYEETVQRETVQANMLAEEAAAQLRAAGLDPHIEVLEGPAADAILRVADVRGNDLIVMGSRGLGNAAALFLGSVSHSVLHGAACPVLIVK